MRVITVHSFKGGTGKTTFAANIATILTLNGYNTVLLDLDFSGPSLYYLVNYPQENPPNAWVNDFLEDRCAQKDFLNEYQQIFNLPAKLLIGLSNPEPSAITDVLSKGRRWQMNALTKLMRLRDNLEKDRFNFIVIDTSPGLRYESINAILLSDLTFILLNVDNFDIHGTQYMIQGIYDNLDKIMHIVLNKVPQKFVNDRAFMSEISEKLKSISPKIRLAGIVPCLPEVYSTLSKEILALTNPKSKFVSILEQLLSRIASIKLREVSKTENDFSFSADGDDCCV